MDEGSGRKGSSLIDSIGRFLTGRKRITEEEIQEIMDAGEEEGIINEEENAMIRSIFELRDTIVREIMVPRTDMACVSADAAVANVLNTIISCGHSRIPVYDGTVDNIIGLIYAKDLLKYWGMSEPAIDLKRIMRAPYFIPETKNLEELLQEFKRKRVHIAIVIDEYGGTSGLVTIEDLLEQIVGDIQDEYDLEEEWLEEEPDGSILVDARLPIEDLEEYFGIEVEREKFDTVAGLIFHLTGRIPMVREEVESDTLRMTVLEAGERNIKKVRIARRSDEAGEAQS
ncbi:hemolysin family protein [Geobacter sulfurreducens]|uniref:CBS and CorC_HlyC domain protein n=1 Tax=Geobacter sulfurreducens (strain ATCC 51573 / DSM 12127 / PCA) TaxID=243231 RepID=Q74AS0_GEOSL|nr:hemolysin family protein [Geobacter sulfurreducens]AAR35658.2 CBS and CorC_HlyC domain protein [Geobacter sulfurreducens PCA]ADI85042.1 CBS and CorC_HlyC domain protein [Geobacter sulfurreducens KN400]UAC02994.1 hemolysin family protein [Geobacter sulfurreducens]HBB69426.1 HlyC/CorC family transporter [Geobacter sulfurreducens]HCD95043.1 HlyC/CorC family transporter [Geobacter sulfurreducens]